VPWLAYQYLSNFGADHGATGGALKDENGARAGHGKQRRKVVDRFGMA
jgi:hypothetical protein